jgi:hypothetical protein
MGLGHTLTLQGLRLLSQEREWRELRRRLDEIFKKADAPAPRRGDLAPFEMDFERALSVARSISAKYAIGCQAAACRMLYPVIKPRLGSALVFQAAKSLLTADLSVEERRSRLLSVACQLTFVPPESFTQSELIRLAELVSTAEPSIHFRPMGDGAASWLVRLTWGGPVLCAVRQLDDRPDIFITTLLIVALLKALEDRLSKEVLLDSEQKGREVSVWVVNADEAATLVPNFYSVLGGELSETSAVTRSTTDTTELIPTFVVCRKDIAEEWSFGSTEPRALHVLLCQLIMELMFVLYKGRVDLEMLSPKIVSFVSRALRC